MLDVSMDMLSPNLHKIVEYLTARIEIENYGDFVLDEKQHADMYKNMWSETTIASIVFKAMQHLKMPFEIIRVSIAKKGKGSTFYVPENGRASKRYKNTAGLYQKSRSEKRITLYYDSRYDAENVIAVVLHEVTHHFLGWKDIVLPETRENERMTDAAAVLLGFGEYMISGYRDITWQETLSIYQSTIHTVNIGYLPRKELKEIRAFRRKLITKYKKKKISAPEKGRASRKGSVLIHIKNRIKKSKEDKEDAAVSQAAEEARKEAETFKMLVAINEGAARRLSALRNAEISAEDVPAVSRIIYLVQSGTNRERQAAFLKKCVMAGNCADVQYFVDLKADITKACTEIAVSNKLLSKYI